MKGKGGRSSFRARARRSECLRRDDPQVRRRNRHVKPGAVLVGLALTALLGWWWADALLAIGISLLAFREGREAWIG